MHLLIFLRRGSTISTATKGSMYLKNVPKTTCFPKDNSPCQGNTRNESEFSWNRRGLNDWHLFGFWWTWGEHIETKSLWKNTCCIRYIVNPICTHLQTAKSKTSHKHNWTTHKQEDETLINLVGHLYMSKIIKKYILNDLHQPHPYLSWINPKSLTRIDAVFQDFGPTSRLDQSFPQTESPTF